MNKLMFILFIPIMLVLSSSLLAEPVWQDELFDAIQAGDAAEVRSAIVDADLNAPKATKQAEGMLELQPFRQITEGELAYIYALKDRENHTQLPLQAAAWYAKNGDIIEMLLDAGADINGKLPANGKSALHIAVEKQNKPLASLLIDRGADINIADNEGMTSLHRTANGDLEMFQLLIERGADVNCRDLKGRTPLHQAIEQRFGQEQFDLFLKHGADVDAADAQAVTLLQTAVVKKQKGMARQLIAAGAKVDTRDETGGSPLLSALATNQFDLAHELEQIGGLKPISEITLLRGETVAGIRYLVQHGLDPNQADEKGNTSLHLVVSGNHQCEQNLLVMLLKNGADPSLKNKAGERAFDIAARKKFFESAKILAYHMNPAPKVDPLVFYQGRLREDYIQLKHQLADGQKGNFKTPLARMDVAAVELLLQSGVDLNAPSSTNPKISTGEAGLWRAIDRRSWLMAKVLLDSGISPSNLHAVVESGQLELASLFMEHGATKDVNLEYYEDRRYWTPLFLAIREGNPPMVELLIKNKANLFLHGEFNRTPVLVYAISLDRRVITDMLLGQKKLAINAAGSNGLTALHVAAKQGRHDLMKRLLDRGANVNAVERTHATPLHWACSSNNLQAVELLVSQGADVNFQGTVKNPGRTNLGEKYGAPLHWAVGTHWPQSREIVEYLLEHGSEVDAENQLGNTPLHIAIGSDNKKIVSLLMHYGARTDVKNKKGETPLDVARRSNDGSLVETLERPKPEK